MHGYTLEDLSNEIGYSRSGIYRACKNDTIKLSSYMKLCELLSVPLGTFVLDVTDVQKVAPASLIAENEEQLKESIKKLNQIVEKLEKYGNQ